MEDKSSSPRPLCWALFSGFISICRPCKMMDSRLYIQVAYTRQTQQHWVTVTFTVDMRLNVFLLSFVDMCGQHFCLGEYECIKRKSLQLLVLPIVERHCLHTLSPHLFENVLHFKNQTFSSLSSLNGTHFPSVSRFIWSCGWRSKPNTPKWKSHCWSVSPPRASLFLFTQKASFFLCGAGGLWEYQGTGVPWGKFPCSL